MRKVLINQIPVKMIVDTGVQVSVLKKKLAVKLGSLCVKAQRNLFSYDLIIQPIITVLNQLLLTLV